ncbi:MAG: TraR/DksA family transcriptional regulator [Acidobacteria bacterium]|nr:TraR/DksA family transcriptional regulator [Acidobacteriota bacterium]
MTKTDFNRFWQVLEGKQTELGRFLRNREGIAIEKNADALDEVQQAAERELAIRNLDRESELLRHVKNALGRLEDGSYGVCLHCEEEINPKRLAAVPWAQYCISCQEIADMRKAQHADDEELDQELVTAA